ncbi:hypothetical protein, partial [Ekhidna sp.]
CHYLLKAQLPRQGSADRLFDQATGNAAWKRPFSMPYAADFDAGFTLVLRSVFNPSLAVIKK